MIYNKIKNEISEVTLTSAYFGLLRLLRLLRFLMKNWSLTSLIFSFIVHKFNRLQFAK